MVTASYASTMHFLTGGRFTLGIGRGIPPMQDAYGIDRITTAQMEDFAQLMRRLWHGETIIGHDGPAGSWPVLRLDPDFDADIPLGLVAFGPKSLELGGRLFDDVILHTFFTDETLVPLRRDGEDAPPSGQGATRPTCASGRASPRSATTSTNRSASRSASGDSRPISRRTAI